MDGASEEGREESAAPGGCEGRAGGSISPGGSEVLDNKTALVFNLGDTVYIQQHGSWCGFKVVALHEFQNALTIENGVGEMIVKPSDLISQTQYEEMVFLQNQQASACRYSRILDAWSTGLRTNKEIAEATSWSRMEVAGAVRSLVHWKLIELPAKSDV
jgi:hypothetical protein